jgi:hypothetical protein
MPRKRIDSFIIVHEWIENLDDQCLANMLVEALVARHFAVKAGAKKHKATRAAIDTGDATVEQIEYGRVSGASACRKAATALRKYTQALDAAEARG